MTLAIFLMLFALWLYTLILLGAALASFKKAMGQVRVAMAQRDEALAMARNLGQLLKAHMRRARQTKGASA
jgi:hypothetical protein